MGKLIFSFTNFIGIKVEKVKLPSYIDPPFNLRAKYSDLLPEISTMVRPYFYIATSEKSEAAYIREMEGIPDLFPLVAYPGKKPHGPTIITMVGLYISELTESGIDKVESACQIIQQTLNDVGLEFDPADIEILMMIPNFSIDLSDTQENIMEENNNQPQKPTKPQQQGDKPRPRGKGKGKGKPQGKGKARKPYVPKPVTVGDVLGPEFVAALMAKVNQGRK